MESNWQPIETAPKDGTPILACAAGKYPVRWPMKVEWENGLWIISDSDRFVVVTLTHWQPLPPLPDPETP